MTAKNKSDTVRILLFILREVLSFLADLESLALASILSFNESLMASSKLFSFIGMMVCIVPPSFTVASCIRLSTRGRASDAFTGVTRSTQYEERRGVRKGTTITFTFLFIILA